MFQLARQALGVWYLTRSKKDLLFLPTPIAFYLVLFAVPVHMLQNCVRPSCDEWFSDISMLYDIFSFLRSFCFAIAMLYFITSIILLVFACIMSDLLIHFQNKLWQLRTACQDFNPSVYMGVEANLLQELYREYNVQGSVEIGWIESTQNLRISWVHINIFKSFTPECQVVRNLV